MTVFVCVIAGGAPQGETGAWGLAHLLCVAVCCSVLQCVAVFCSVLQCVAVCCSVLQCVAVCCSVLQCVAVHDAFRQTRRRHEVGTQRLA